jgi:hypothetical protein
MISLLCFTYMNIFQNSKNLTSEKELITEHKNIIY